MSTLIKFIGNDCVLELNGLKDAVTSTYLNTSSVTYSLKDNAGNIVDSGTMAYVSSSNGIYRALLADSLSLVENAEYVAIIDADSGPGLKYHSESLIMAKVRT